MGEQSKIEGTDATWPVVTGCTKVSAGCRHCYAIRDGWRLSHHPNPKVSAPYVGVVERRTNKAETWLDWSGVVPVHADRLDWPLRWKRPRRICVCNESDLFHEGVPDEFIVAIFGIMAASLQHTFQILTKRPERMRAWSSWLADRGGLGGYIRSIRVDGDRTLPHWFDETAKTEVVRGRTGRCSNDPWMVVFNAAACIGSGPLPNVWLGVSVEDQQSADDRIPLLLQTPAAVRFVSAEPLLGSLNLARYLVGRGDVDDLRGISWVIVGGESGPQARPMHADWARSIRDQCRAARVPFLFKQWGAWVPVIGRHGGPPHYQDFEHDILVPRVGKIDCIPMRQVGKQAAGRLLDGRTWDEFPRVNA